MLWFRLESYVFTRIGKPDSETKEELYDSFRDLITWMHTALRSGYSMENAVLEAAGQLEQSLGKENILVQELRRMRHKMMISVSVEQLFQDLAVRSRIDDIATFASVLVIAKRTGEMSARSFRIRGIFSVRELTRCGKSVQAFLHGGSSRIL